MIAWTDWMYTGNTESLLRCYDALKADKLLAFCARASDGLLETTHIKSKEHAPVCDIVDWPPGERDGFDFKPVNAVINAFHCLNLRQMAEIAAALGKEDEARDFSTRAETLMRTFHDIFYNRARGCYRDGEGSDHSSLHANMFPLAFGIVPEAERERVANFVKSRGMACSVYGSQYLLEALFQAGMDDAALSLMTDSGPRSWINMLREGSTISMEAWGIRYKPNLDWNHAWGAAPVNIIARYVLGVRPLTPGFGKVLIRPQTGSLEGVQGTVPTIRGPITVGVRHDRRRCYRLIVEIPANMTARLELPPLQVSDDEVSLDRTTIQPVFKDGYLILDELPSGKHLIVWQKKGMAPTTFEPQPRITKEGFLKRNWPF